MAVQGRLAGMGDQRDHDGHTDESGPGDEKTLWHFYPPVAKRHDPLPGKRRPRILAKGGRKEREYRRPVCQAGTYKICGHGSLCTMALLTADLSGYESITFAPD